MEKQESVGSCDEQSTALWRYFEITHLRPTFDNFPDLLPIIADNELPRKTTTNDNTITLFIDSWVDNVNTVVNFDSED